MELYDKLSNVYPADHLSVSTTQTIIEETCPSATTSEAIIEHTGTEVLKISKDLLVEERDSIPDNPHAEVCDGIIGIDVKDKFIGYFELKSACTRGNVLKACSQIQDSVYHFWSAATKCSIDMLGYEEKGIIVTQSITDEERVQNRKRLIRDNDKNIRFSSSRFMHNLLAGRAEIYETKMPLLHFNAGEIISLGDLL